MRKVTSLALMGVAILSLSACNKPVDTTNTVDTNTVDTNTVDPNAVPLMNDNAVDRTDNTQGMTGGEDTTRPK